MADLVIIDYGAGNVKSVDFALRRLGASPLLTNDPEVIAAAKKVVFPGVGHAEFAMNALRQCELDSLIPTLKVPVLGICLGMQLMCKKTEEGNVDGLGIFSSLVKRFPATGKIPHMGWNSIDIVNDRLFKDIKGGSFVYFVHSYFAEIGDDTSSTSSYILPFSASMQRDNFFGCQFHPEKSGLAGETILSNFLKL